MTEHDLRIEGHYEPLARLLQYSLKLEALDAKDWADGAYDATLLWSLWGMASSVHNHLKSKRASCE